MQKLKAFTLLELLIAMVISSIVVAFGYSVYSLMYKQYLSYKKTKTEIVKTMQFNTVLTNDFYNSEEITFSENTIVIFKKNNEPLLYTFNDNFILRKTNEITDTFKIATTNIQGKFVFKNESFQSTLIDEFSFDSQLSGDVQHFLFAKNYSAATLLNKEVKFQKPE